MGCLLPVRVYIDGDFQAHDNHGIRLEVSAHYSHQIRACIFSGDAKNVKQGHRSIYFPFFALTGNLF